jgi:endonuclease G
MGPIVYRNSELFRSLTEANMLIRPSVVADAEKRMPIAAATARAKRAVAAEALVQPGPAVTPKPIDVSTVQRIADLSLAGAKPSTTELERLIGNNDLVDEFYLQRGLVAARPVMRIILRDPAGRERGWATGFMVSPRLLLTNWHVFPTQDETTNAIAEAHYVLDIAGNPAPSYRFAIRGDLYYTSDAQLDFALVAVDPVAQDGRTALAQFGYHRLIAEPNKIREGECMTLIQHPGGERRQVSIRENELTNILDQFLWYKSDTAPGSSGAPAFNDSYQVVALHHSGAARRDDQGRYLLRDGTTVTSLEGIDDSRVDWVANEGLRISVLCSALTSQRPPDNSFVRELFLAMQGGDVISQALGGGVPAESIEPGMDVAPHPATGNVFTIPLQLQISLATGGVISPPARSVDRSPVAAAAPTAPVGVEALRYPKVDRDYTTRTGYQADFLGVPAPLPTITDPSLVSKTADGNCEIPYEHFSIVVNKKRRLPLFTASNVDYTPKKRQPEPGEYSRDALDGIGPNDQEKWLTDPRIPQQDQLPDVFYTKDGGSFDKGHVVRREDMCWGDSYEQIVRANCDTFHVTNCTPQVLGFNRSNKGEDNWGDLENEIQKQAKAERLCILAGPILAAEDKVFEGKDDFGPVKIQIPREFWKVVLANDHGQLAAYAFVLQQELQNVPLEFRVNATWTPYLVSLAYLEGRLLGLVFSPQLHAADRSATDGHELAQAIGVQTHSSVTEGTSPH